MGGCGDEREEREAGREGDRWRGGEVERERGIEVDREAGREVERGWLLPPSNLSSSILPLSLPQMCAISGLLLSLPDAVAPTSLLFGVRFSFSSAAGFCH